MAMKPKYKTTGCFRFFIFFLIFIPAVYFGATYFRGENGWQMIKEFFGKIGGQPHAQTPNHETNTYTSDDCKAALKKAQDENDDLKRQLRDKENEISTLKKTVN